MVSKEMVNFTLRSSLKQRSSSSTKIILLQYTANPSAF